MALRTWRAFLLSMNKDNWWSLIGAAIGGLWNWMSSVSVNKANKQIMKEQNQFNVDMWNKNNEYNSPENQVSRLRSAGLNPAFSSGMIEGSVSSAPAAGATSPDLKAPQFDMSSIASLINASINLQDHQQHLKNETQKTVNDTVRADANYKSAMSEIELNLSRKNLNHQMVKESQAHVQQIFSSCEEINQRIQNLKVDRAFTSKQMSRFDEQVTAKIRLDESSAKYYGSLLKVNAETAEKIHQETIGTILRNGITSREFDASQVMYEFQKVLAKYNIDELKWKAENGWNTDHIKDEFDLQVYQANMKVMSDWMESINHQSVWQWMQPDNKGAAKEHKARHNVLDMLNSGGFTPSYDSYNPRFGK